MDSSVSLFSELSEYLVIQSPTPPFSEFGNPYLGSQNNIDSRFLPPPKSSPNQIVPKKIRKKKMKFSEFQQQLLQQEFQRNMFPTNEQMYELAIKLNIDGNTVKVWFRNRRAKMKSQKGGPEMLAKEKSKYSVYMANQENISSNTNFDNTYNAQEIKSKFRGSENLSLRELLNQAPAIPQHRPSSTSSTTSLSSEATSDSTDLYSPELKYETDRVNQLKYMYSNVNQIDSLVCPTIESYLQPQAENMDSYIGHDNARDNANNTNNYYQLHANRYSVQSEHHFFEKNSLQVQDGQHFTDRNAMSVQSGPQFSSRRLLPVKSSSNFAPVYNYTQKTLPNTSFVQSNHSDQKYFKPSKSNLSVEQTNVAVQNAIISSQTQLQLEVNTFDEYSFENNLTPDEIDMILNADPVEQNQKLCSLRFLLTYLGDGGCDCTTCIFKN